MSFGQWIVLHYGQDCHVMPLEDIAQHSQIDCPCHPTRDDEDPSIVTHYAFDGREAFEEKKRKPS